MEKMIEEMAKDLKLIKLLQASNVYTPNYQEAKALFSLGYRKIPDGAVVLSKEEFEFYEEMRKENIDFLMDNNDLLLQVKELKEELKQFGVGIEAK